MSQALRKLTSTISKSKTSIIFINQIRQKIGVMWGNPETTPGGLALKFYATIRLDIRRVESVKKGDEITGNHVRVKVVKNKVAAPFRQAEFDITFGQGIDKPGYLIDIGVADGIIEKSGAFFAYKNEKLGQGRDNAKIFLLENPAVASEIEATIRKKYFEDAPEVAKVTEAVEEKETPKPRQAKK
jgi:recombination protein RecA